MLDSLSQPCMLTCMSLQQLQVWKPRVLAGQILCGDLRGDHCEAGEKPLWLERAADTSLLAAPGVLPESPTSRWPGASTRVAGLCDP